ncbi:MAG: hypothetical protein HYX95_01130 [Chloroflexi bacterium]|nr:hypothetical protein [Chloroflexota bacterium]
MSETGTGSADLKDMDQRQLQLYARDLAQLYWSERRARSSLAEEKLVLEYKVRELGALNTMIRSSLKEKQDALEDYRWLLRQLKELAALAEGDAGVALRQLVVEAEARGSGPGGQAEEG